MKCPGKSGWFKKRYTLKAWYRRLEKKWYADRSLSIQLVNS